MALYQGPVQQAMWYLETVQEEGGVNVAVVGVVSW